MTVLAVLLLLVVIIQLIFLDQLRDSEGDAPNDFRGRVAANADEIEAFRPFPVSVLICASNESANLEANLGKVLDQVYHDEAGRPLFEVIVVNDCSTDDSALVLQQFAAQNPNLRIIGLEAGQQRRFSGKKGAVSAGIAAASHDVVVVTDADCWTVSRYWLRWMAFPFQREDVDIVAGYGAYEQAPGFLNKFIRAETLHTFMLFYGLTRLGRPYMATGRNLAYRRHLIESAQEEPLWRETISGDDDMLIRICATRHNMVVNTHPQSQTCSTAKSDWSAYILQKQRHLSTGKHYSRAMKHWLGAYGLSHTLFWLLVICAVVLGVTSRVTPGVLIAFAMVAFIRLAWFYGAMWTTCSILKERHRLFLFWPVFDLCWMLYNLFFSPYILWKTKQRWK